MLPNILVKLDDIYSNFRYLLGRSYWFRLALGWGWYFDDKYSSGQEITHIC
ncbi:MAG: hypothetical protein PUP93_24550 [Rhizonema sp. NSF051]|nr:hypothetical protein [Rhizonema sp. NSF051]